MALYSTIKIQHDNDSNVSMQEILKLETGNRFKAGNALKAYFRSLLSGARSAKVTSSVNLVCASGGITFTSLAAADTITINGQVLTARASGAVANEFNLGADDTAAAAAAAVVINAHATLGTMMVATSALGVLTLTAIEPGVLGNAITTAISAHGTADAARLAGGTSGSVVKTHYYGSAS